MDKDETIKRLKDELWLTRLKLIGLAPNDVRQLLKSYYHCQSRQESSGWLEDISEKIIDKAKPIPRYQNGYGDRANCPLCGEGNSSGYLEGFTLPEGLRRHVVGFGNVNQCVFTEAAQKLANEHWNQKFSDSEAEERQQAQRQLTARHATETLYKIAPLDEPKLIDQDIWYSEKCRNTEQLAWAESRLSALGFQKNIDDRILSWTDERENFIVYADPRRFGRIDFSVWKKPLPKRINSNSYRYRLTSFHLLDSWKNDLTTKYEARLTKK